MADANLAVTFSASIDNLTAGIAEAKDALSSLSSPISEMNTQYATLGASITQAFAADKVQAFNAALLASVSVQNSLAAAHAQAAAAIRSGDDASYADAMRASKLAISEEIKDVEDGLKQKLALFSEEATRHEITQQQKVTMSRQATDAEYQAELGLLQQEQALGTTTLAQKQQIDDKILDAERRHQDQMASLVQKSISAQQQQYENFGNAISQSFNSQLHGLIDGTTNWQTAFKNILADLLIKFIEWGETTVIQHVANEAAKTAATTAGVAARTGAEQSGAAASLATQAATMIRSIMSSAAEAFAGVFGFLAPIMGPFAAGPAAAAQATVAGVAGSVASADIGMWQVPKDMLSLVHHNELIMPAAEAGAFRDMLEGGAQPQTGGGAVHIHPTTNFHVSAVDSGSVAQWMKNNSPAMMKAMDEAVRHGAHLGLRRLAGA
ncbi:hypothetical protein [Methylocapsa sp. S129]|uniref:hypothetical protein n=1 Tax=Methylocapsa sp. S129 TaxID=1641869 RepID=UPI00131B1F92|nr:hypothetical protein [Methylocapsa sp. S129]